MQTVRRRCAQTAHISLHVHQCQRARGQNKPRRQSPSVPRTALPSEIPNFRIVVALLSHRFVFASVRHRRCFASVRRYLRRPAGSRKRKKTLPTHFFHESQKTLKIWGLAQEKAQLALRCGNLLALAACADRQSGCQATIRRLGSNREARSAPTAVA